MNFDVHVVTIMPFCSIDNKSWQNFALQKFKAHQKIQNPHKSLKMNTTPFFNYFIKQVQFYLSDDCICTIVFFTFDKIF